MELETVMRTTAAVRQYTDDPLDDATLYAILDDARFAPNGGNRQSWHVIVVRDPATKRRLADLYEVGMREYAGFTRAGLVPFVASEAHWRNPPGAEPTPAIDLEAARQVPVPPGSTDHLVAAPVLLVITLDLTNVSAVDTGLDRLPLTAAASVFPFAQNILLAARDRGYGGHLTSVLSRCEPEVKALLGIPDDHVLATMVPLGRPVHQVTRLRRIPVEDFATVGRFDGAPLEPPAGKS